MQFAGQDIDHLWYDIVGALCPRRFSFVFEQDIPGIETGVPYLELVWHLRHAFTLSTRSASAPDWLPPERAPEYRPEIPAYRLVLDLRVDLVVPLTDELEGGAALIFAVGLEAW